MLEKVDVEEKLKTLRKMKHYDKKDIKEILEFLDFCGREFADDEKIQSQRITILIKLNKLEDALKICEEYPNNDPIQSQRVTIFIKLNKLKETLKICEEYPNNEPIQSQRITILIKLKKLKEALKICEEYPNNDPIQSQRVTILMKLNKLKEALEICKQYPNYEPIQSQRITILIGLNRLDEALEICKQYPNYESIQSQRITILMKLKRLKEALEICNEHPNNEIINIQKNKIIETLDNQSILYKGGIINMKMSDIFNSENKTIQESKFLTNIYLDKITEEEIKSSEISDYNKTILLIAYYEKNNKKKGIQIIKQKKKEVKNKEELKTYNILLNKLSSNKLFDVLIYTKMLNCSINFNEYDIQENKKEENIIITKQNNIEISKQEIKNKKETKYIISTGKVVNNRNNNKEQIETNLVEKKQKEILIKDLFENEIIEISKQVYLELYNLERQKEAIKAWDILEDLINTPVNKKSLEKMIRIINKIYPENIEQNKKKYTKYIL